MPDEPLFDVVAQVFDQVCDTAAGREALKWYDHTLIFSPLDGDPFYVDIRNGDARPKRGLPPPRPITEAHEFKANEAVFRDFFTSRRRLYDAVHEGDLYPMAAHTAKRHIDFWLVRLVSLSNGVPTLKDQY